MNTKARKVMIIGAGNVGASAAYALLNQNICEEILLVDLNRERAEGHAQDLSDAAAYMPGMMTISTREVSECADVDIAVITVSGGALKPGQTRLDELTNTARIVKSIVPQMMENGFKGIFLIATLWARPKTSDKDTHYPINIWLFAVIMGLMQAISILPAISRSGATVCTALLLGLSRSRSVEYSFLMSIPVIILATIYESIFSDVPLGIVSFFPALFGFITSLVSGIIFLWLLVWITRRGQLHYFAFYTIPLGLLVLGYYFWIQ